LSAKNNTGFVVRFLATVTLPGRPGQRNERLKELGLNPIGRVLAILRDVLPDCE